MYTLNTVEEGIEAIKRGEMIVVVDDADRENEGDLVMAAEHATGEAINFMAQYGRGLICLPVERAIGERLGLTPMVTHNTEGQGTAFTISIDYEDTTTGISAYERALTIQKVVEAGISAEAFKRPGHVFPLIAEEEGVLKRDGHTEAAVDLAKLAGLKPAGVICEIMKPDGHMARMPELQEFAKVHNLKMISIEDLITYRKAKMQKVQLMTKAKLPTAYGDFEIYGFQNSMTGAEHVALVKGTLSQTEPVLVRVHSECLTGDAFGSLKCDCGKQYDYAMKQIAKEGSGVLIYLRQEGRGIGLINKIKAYALQDQGLDTVEANLQLGLPIDARRYEVGADILKTLGISNIRLMTNNLDKLEGLTEYGINVVERVPIIMPVVPQDAFYMQIKKEKLGHLLD